MSTVSMSTFTVSKSVYPYRIIADSYPGVLSLCYGKLDGPSELTWLLQGVHNPLDRACHAVSAGDACWGSLRTPLVEDQSKI